jgi:hypothetical protein
MHMAEYQQTGVEEPLEEVLCTEHDPMHIFWNRGQVLIRYGVAVTANKRLVNTWQALRLEHGEIVEVAQGLIGEELPSWVPDGRRTHDRKPTAVEKVEASRNGVSTPLLVANGDPRWLWRSMPWSRGPSLAAIIVRRYGPEDVHGDSPEVMVEGGLELRFTNQLVDMAKHPNRIFLFTVAGDKAKTNDRDNAKTSFVPLSFALHYNPMEIAAVAYFSALGQLSKFTSDPDAKNNPSIVDGAEVSLVRDVWLGDTKINKGPTLGVQLARTEAAAITAVAATTLDFPSPLISQLYVNDGSDFTLRRIARDNVRLIVVGHNIPPDDHRGGWTLGGDAP